MHAFGGLFLCHQVLPASTWPYHFIFQSGQLGVAQTTKSRYANRVFFISPGRVSLTRRGSAGPAVGLRPLPAPLRGPGPLKCDARRASRVGRSSWSVELGRFGRSAEEYALPEPQLRKSPGGWLVCFVGFGLFPPQIKNTTRCGGFPFGFPLKLR